MAADEEGKSSDPSNRGPGSPSDPGLIFWGGPGGAGIAWAARRGLIKSQGFRSRALPDPYTRVRPLTSGPRPGLRGPWPIPRLDLPAAGRPQGAFRSHISPKPMKMRAKAARLPH